MAWVTVWRTNRTDPSHIVTLLPPVWSAYGSPLLVQFIGSATAVYAACKKAGARFMPHPRRNEGLLVRDDFAEAVMADLERRGYRMDVTL